MCYHGPLHAAGRQRELGHSQNLSLRLSSGSPTQRPWLTKSSSMGKDASSTKSTSAWLIDSFGQTRRPILSGHLHPFRLPTRRLSLPKDHRSCLSQNQRGSRCGPLHQWHHRSCPPRVSPHPLPGPHGPARPGRSLGQVSRPCHHNHLYRSGFRHHPTHHGHWPSQDGGSQDLLHRTSRHFDHPGQEVSELPQQTHPALKCTTGARAFISRLLNTLATKHAGSISLSPAAKADRRWFIVFLGQFNGVTLIKPATAQHVIQVDSCLQGGGGICSGLEFYKLHHPDHIQDLGLSICSLECWNLPVAACLWLPTLTGYTVMIVCDNLATVAAIISGRAMDPIIRGPLLELCWLAATHKVQLEVRHKPGAKMVAADTIRRAAVSIAAAAVDSGLGRQLTLAPALDQQPGVPAEWSATLQLSKAPKFALFKLLCFILAPQQVPNIARLG